MRAPHVELDWADGLHRFALPIKELRELQDKTGVGPAALYRRLSSHDWRVDDAGEILRLGLIGGGMEPPAALRLIRRYVHERPLLESIGPALEVIGWALLPEPQDAQDEADKKKAMDPTIPEI